MDPKIITKFTIANEQGMGALLYLTQTIAREKLLPLLSKAQVEAYLVANFSEKVLTVELNNMSNQWLVVYVNEQPMGYVKITSKGENPKALAQKRAIRIADFGLLEACTDPLAKQSLFDKCLSVCKAYEAIWIGEYATNPFLAFFEAQGFVRQEEAYEAYELPLPAVCLVKQQ